MENCNISNRTTDNLFINEFGSRVNFKGNRCLPCAEVHALSSGDITVKSKADKGIRRDAATAAAAEYERLYSTGTIGIITLVYCST